MSQNGNSDGHISVLQSNEDLLQRGGRQSTLPLLLDWLALVQNHKKEYNFADWISIDLDEGEMGCKNDLAPYHQIIARDFFGNAYLHSFLSFFISWSERESYITISNT